MGPRDHNERIVNLKNSKADSADALMVWNLVTALCPEAPRPGRYAKVYTGVVRTKEGRKYRVHYVAVRDPQKDEARPCLVLGYKVQTAAAAGVWPWDHNTVTVLVRVQLLHWDKLRRQGFGALLKREYDCHVDCLQCVTTKKKART